MTVALQLARFVTDVSVLPTGTRNAAVRTVLDLLTAALAGMLTPGGTAARRAARSTWGAGPATAWFSAERLTVCGAAFANSAIASMLDLDDGHRAAAGHPGAAVIPAVFATAEAQKASAERVLTAIAIGYEVGVRVSAARDFDELHTFDSGLWCGQGVAAAAAWLRGLTPDIIAHAIAIAGTSAPGQSATAYTKIMGNHVKEGIPFATATALTAVDLAAAGFTGPTDLLDQEAIYKRDVLLGDLGGRWSIEDVYFKPYSCCRWAHAAIDAALELQARRCLAASDIGSIQIATFSTALKLNNDVRPRTLEAAQYSIPFCVALAVTRGAGALLPLREQALSDEAVLSLAERITISVDSELDAMFSRAVPARVVVATSKGRFTHTVLAPKGEPSNPLNWEELEAKFDQVAEHLMGAEERIALKKAVRALETGEVAPLRGILSRPLMCRTLSVGER